MRITLVLSIVLATLSVTMNVAGLDCESGFVGGGTDTTAVTFVAGLEKGADVYYVDLPDLAEAPAGVGLWKETNAIPALQDTARKCGDDVVERSDQAVAALP